MDSEFASPGGVMNIMDESGHQQLRWQRSNPDDLIAARKTFDRLISQGYVAFGSGNKSEPKHTLNMFDPTMEELVMVPRIVGG